MGKSILCNVHLIFIIYIILVYLGAPQARGQIGQSYFPANPANLYDWRSAMLNPSIGAFQTGAVEVGFKVFHFGFVDENSALFKSSYGLLNLPRLLPLRLAFGLQSQLFATPIFRETELKMNLSRQFWGVFSLGVTAGFRGISYQSENFDLVDPDDPVFSRGTSRWQPDLGAGMTVLLFSRVIVGVGASHLNSPSVSLVDNTIKLKPAVTLGLALNLSSIGLYTSGNRVEEVNGTPRGFVQLYDESIGMLQMGYGENSLFLRSRLHLYGPLSIGYGFSYPMADLQGTSSGNHEATFLYEFDRLRSIPKMGIPPTQWTPFVPEMSRINIVPQYYVLADNETVDIYEKKLVREIAEGVELDSSYNLYLFDVGILDSSFEETDFPFSLVPIPLNDSIQGDSVKYSPEYLRTLNKLGMDLQNKDSVKVWLITPQAQEKRAVALKNLLRENILTDDAEISIGRSRFENDQDSVRLARPVNLKEIKSRDRLVILRPSYAKFTVYSVLPRQVQPWSFIIENMDGEQIYSYTTADSQLTIIRWDWRDKFNQIIQPGFYRYYISWFDEWNAERRSPSQLIYARKLKRNIHVKITRKYETPAGELDKVGIILNKQ